MSDPLHDVFEIHEPPPGGLAELRRRVRGDGHPRRAWLGGMAVAAGAVALMVTVLHQPDPGVELARGLACGDPVLSGLFCGAPEPGATIQPAHRERLALRPVPVLNDGVLVYRVASAGQPLAADQIGSVRSARD
jgi:hypothetical protein